jgi:DNA-directed RNA polymerase specialized sigma24 family protein
VLDFSAPPSKRVVEALEEPRTRTLLHKFAVWLTHSEADAEDLVSDAIHVMCDPQDGRPWDPARGTLLAHARVVMVDLAKARRRRAATRREVPGDLLALAEEMPHAGPAPDEALSDARLRGRLERLGGRLRESIGHLPRAVQVFDLGCQGVEKPDEQAHAIGCDVREVYEANRQIARHAARVLADEQKEEAARMNALREKAKNNAKKNEDPR